MAEAMETGSTDWRGEGVILVVDDDELIRQVAQTILQGLGFTVLTAKDGHEGVELFRQHAGEIRLVLLDLSMPTLSGEEAFHEMRGIRPDVRVILFTGYADEEAITRVSGKGLAGFIPKPVQIAQFVQKIREVLGE